MNTIDWVCRFPAPSLTLVKIIFNLTKIGALTAQQLNKVPTELGAENVLISFWLVNTHLEALYADAESLTRAEKVKLFWLSPGESTPTAGGSSARAEVSFSRFSQHPAYSLTFT